MGKHKEKHTLTQAGIPTQHVYIRTPIFLSFLTIFHGAGHQPRLARKEDFTERCRVIHRQNAHRGRKEIQHSCSKYGDCQGQGKSDPENRQQLRLTGGSKPNHRLVQYGPVNSLSCIRKHVPTNSASGMICIALPHTWTCISMHMRIYIPCTCTERQRNAMQHTPHTHTHAHKYLSYFRFPV